MIKNKVDLVAGRNDSIQYWETFQSSEGNAINAEGNRSVISKSATYRID